MVDQGAASGNGARAERGRAVVMRALWTGAAGKWGLCGRGSCRDDAMSEVGAPVGQGGGSAPAGAAARRAPGSRRSGRRSGRAATDRQRAGDGQGSRPVSGRLAPPIRHPLNRSASFQFETITSRCHWALPGSAAASLSAIPCRRKACSAPGRSPCATRTSPIRSQLTERSRCHWALPGSAAASCRRSPCLR